jgi:hypothetical protein
MASFLPVFPGSLQEAGANLHNNAVDAGNSLVARGKQALGIPAEILHGFAGFMQGLQTGQNGGAPSVTVQLPPATPAKGSGKTSAPTSLGQLSPAAAAVLANAASPPAKAAAADPLGALGNLSFRQLLTLSQASENLQPKGSTKAPSTTDAAGAALASIYQQQFKSSIDAAGKDPAKQQAAVDAFEKKMLPIALKGNTADEYLYGSQ